jgi:hypothetical protein
MPRFPTAKIRRSFLHGDAATNSHQRGAILEDTAIVLFEAVPGVWFADRNIVNPANAEEVDVIFWNERRASGLYFLEAPFIVECKNWTGKVDGQEIVYFANTMRGRCCRDGILIASNGITGDPGQLTEAYFQISMAARNGQRILVLTRTEIEALTNSKEFVTLLKTKVLDVTIKGTKVV